GSAPAPPRTPSHGDGWGGGVSLSPLLPFQAPADAGRLLYLVQRLFPFRGLGGDRRIEYPGEPQGLLVGKILFTLLFHNQSSYLSPRSGAFFLGPSGARCSWASFCAAFSCSAIGGWRLASLWARAASWRSMLRTRTASCSGVMYSFTT